MKTQILRRFHKVLRFLRERRRKSCLKKAALSIFINKPRRGFDFWEYFEHRENFKSLKPAFDKFYGRTIGRKIFRELYEGNIRTIA